MPNDHLEHRWREIQALLPAELQHPLVWQSIQISLLEDLAPTGNLAALWEALPRRDVTSAATLERESALNGQITTKTGGVVAGLPVFAAIFALIDPDLKFSAHHADGDVIAIGAQVAAVHGPGAALLTAERTALNYLGRMSGIATLTRQYVEAVAGTPAVILDTRKTAPGLRLFDKYAVRMGGGQNHRMGLFDMVLIKDNHIDGAGSITATVERVRTQHGNQYPIEVEVKTLAELDEALRLAPTRMMLDNMSVEMMRQAVEITAGAVPLEASGNVSLQTVRAIAETGVDYISVGALTHSVPVLDVSMRLK